MKKETIDKITLYHIRQRDKCYKKNGGTMKNIKLHNFCHGVLLPFIKLLRILRKEKLIIVGDKRTNKIKPAIYACTHIGGFDVENLFEAIKSPCYLFIADPKEVYANLDGLMLWLNGAIFFESYDKTDRNIAKIKACELMKSGGSLMIFPEGAWNIYESLPVMPLFWGTADIAIQSGADIIPVAIERFENKYYVNIGERIDCGSVGETDKEVITQILRDELAALKYEIWDSRGMYLRSELKDTRESFLNKMFGEKDTSFTVEDVIRTRFYPKDEVNETEVWKFMNDIEQRKENAFMWRRL